MAWRGLTDDNQAPGRHQQRQPGRPVHFGRSPGNRELSADLDPAGVRLAIVGMVAIPVVMPT